MADHQDAIELIETAVRADERQLNFHKGEVDVMSRWIASDEERGRTPEKSHIKRRDLSAEEVERLTDRIIHLNASLKLLREDQP